jgi:hypothetical protein
MANVRSVTYLREHQAHDVRALLARWRRAVRGTGFRLQTLGKKDGFPLVVAHRHWKDTETPGFYVSAGIHGDEPAAPWGLLEWFECGGHALLGERPTLLFPCLNPWGVAENRRDDGEGRDLNRIFDDVSRVPIREVREWVRGRRFQLAICLHEDYDALGAYLYDLNREGDGESARRLLRRSITRRLPVDERGRIDGRLAEEGVIFRRRLDRRRIPGWPEAVFLFLEGYAARTFTFETPSEFSLVDRVEVQSRFMEAAAHWCGPPPSRP